MKLSINFLKDYIDVPDVHTLGEDMTNVGNEYDSAKPLLEVEGLKIGKILECKMHPDSDHLHLCKVDIGSEVLNIVCGAPNAREGIKVIVAVVGAKLPGLTIKKGKIRTSKKTIQKVFAFFYIFRYFLKSISRKVNKSR